MEISPASYKPPIPEINGKMPVEVMRDFDTALLFGELTDAGLAALTVRRMSGEDRFPVVEPGSIVLVRCYDSGMNPVILRARVLRSSEDECTAGRLEMIPYKTRRKHIRYPLCPPAEISVLNDAAPEQPQSCQLVNISAAGACIVARCACAVGQTLSLWIKMEQTKDSAPYPCRVTRATPRRSGSFEYGLLFGSLNEHQRGCLTDILRDRFCISFGAEKG